MIRPQPARWFEVLAARDDVARVLEALAATGATELEARASAGLPQAIVELQPLHGRFTALALRYAAYWPPPKSREQASFEPPAAVLARCLELLGEWSTAAEPIVARLQRNASERAELALWRRVLAACAGSTIDWSLAAAAGPTLAARLVVCAPGHEPPLPGGALVRKVVLDGKVHALVVCSAADVATLTQQATVHKAAVHAMHGAMDARIEDTLGRIEAQLADVDRDDDQARADLKLLEARYDLAHVLADAERLQWLVTHVHALEADELFCRITGWTSELAGDRLERAIERSGARALLHYPSAPDGARAPLVLANPGWARPFEIFSRALGMPERTEADPTTLLAFVVPLLFGYMFGDVGQGAVIAVAGMLLHRRWPVARLFIAGGAVGMVFGALFGSVFSLHGLIAPLWVDPLANPLPVLMVPLYGGAALLTVGLLLSAVEARWRGELEDWLRGELWLALVYVALVLSVVEVAALYVAAGAAVAYCISRGIASRKPLAALAAIAELVERTLQILINTLSFARVGAFALAHAGLSSAIVALMDGASSYAVKALVLVLGNAVVIVLEAMVVSIQTTRLVLFEFFTRFLVAPGRVFSPLPPPPFLTQES